MSDGSPTATLLVSCPDQKGIVAAVSAFLYDNGGNIIHADQHTDLEEQVFLQRVEWELDGFGLDRDEIAPAFTPIARRFGMDWRVRFSDVRPRLAVFVSRQGHCLYDLLARWSDGELACEIPLIVSNHAEPAAAAEAFGVGFHHLAVTADTKEAQEAKALDLLVAEDVETVVLARYMQVLSPDFVARYPNRLINIHHSFLPAFTGARPYHQAHERGVKVIGATAHYVTSELDAGPIIAQGVAPVSHRDSVDDLVRSGRDLEKVVLARAVRLHLEHRVLVYGNRTVVFD
jgi:formyltetrahydrofolate deformylase